MLGLTSDLWHAGDLPAGIALYEKALAHNPKHADALYNMGVAWVEAGELYRAIHCYELAVHFNPMCAEAHNNLGAHELRLEARLAVWSQLLQHDHAMLLLRQSAAQE